MDRPDPAPDQARDRGPVPGPSWPTSRCSATPASSPTPSPAASSVPVSAPTWSTWPRPARWVPTVPDDDVLVVGAPTHAFSLSRASSRAQAIEQGAPLDHEERGMREWLAEAPEPPPGAHHAATFDTRVTKVRHLPGSAAVKATRILRRHHYLVEDAPRSFYVEDPQGPLVAGEVDRAEEWGAELGAAQVARGRSPRA